METEFKDRRHVVDLACEIERQAAHRELWPGFDPLAIPLAFYDGDETYLLRFPGIPEGFRDLRIGAYDVPVYSGRHPTVVANSTATIAGTPVASVMIDKSRAEQTTTDLAAIAIHEAFHVYQDLHHPTWQTDIGALFVYPFDNAKLLALRRIETEALRRALAASDLDAKLGWTLRALYARRDRYTGMASAFSTFERKTELIEGLAAYVEALAADKTGLDLPVTGYRAEEIRQRCYKTGHAFAVLLDVVAPDWKTVFESEDDQALDLYLVEAIEKKTSKSGFEDFALSEIADFDRIAHEDVQNLVEQRIARKQTFNSRTGMRFTVIASNAAPLKVRGLDPSNALLVEGGVLHTRFIRLHHAQGQLEMLSSLNDAVEALTVAVGPHPLFSDVLTFEVAGLDTLNVVSDHEGVRIASNGLSAHFNQATVTESDAQITVYLNTQD